MWRGGVAGGAGHFLGFGGHFGSLGRAPRLVAGAGLGGGHSGAGGGGHAAAGGAGGRLAGTG